MSFIWILNKPYRYAQHRGGQKLHLAEAVGESQIKTRVLCGRVFDKFRMTINLPLGHACKNCIRQANRLREA